MPAESNGRYDAVVIGAGPGGSGAAGRLADAGLRVAMVESELVGGECPFWACIPSKALLRPVEAVGEGNHVAGVEAGVASMQEVLEYRDYMNSGLDDTGKAKAFADRGVEVVRGPRAARRGRAGGRGRPGARDRAGDPGHRHDQPRSRDIDGLEQAGYWTNREATPMSEVPESAVVLGGGPVGIELSQAMSRLGSTGDAGAQPRPAPRARGAGGGRHARAAAVRGGDRAAAGREGRGGGARLGRPLHRAPG